MDKIAIVQLEKKVAATLSLLNSTRLRRPEASSASVIGELLVIATRFPASEGFATVLWQRPNRWRRVEIHSRSADVQGFLAWHGTA